MAGETSPEVEHVRAAEIAAVLCLGTDLGLGVPFEHGLHGTLIGMRLADRLGVDAGTASQTYYACLLMHAGCTADADTAMSTFGGSLTEHLVPVIFGSRREMLAGMLRALPPPGASRPVRIAHVARRLPVAARQHVGRLVAICEVAEMLCERLGLPPAIHRLFAHLTERWDGEGPVRGERGDAIPAALRIAHVARDAAMQRLVHGPDAAAGIVRGRAGHAFDPEVAACLADDAADILAVEDERSAWDEVMACEPRPVRVLDPDGADRALTAVGDFADLASPHFSGHSAAVATLAAAAARRCGLDDRAVSTVRRAGLVHDIGRVAVHPRVWGKPGPLTPEEWEQVRLHPYRTERVLSRGAALSGLAAVAGAHHERLDGSGYHRGATAATIGVAARVLAAADAYRAMVEPRAHRPARSPAEAPGELAREAVAGKLDPDAVAAVVEAAGQRPPAIERPAGLTEREAQVVGLVARGLQTKQVARALGISGKTADRHIQHAYRKIGVSTRAAATLFAMEHGLVAWGELPIGRPATAP